MDQLTQAEALITEFIYRYPEVVVGILVSNGYKISGKVTLPKIITATFKAVYSDKNQTFINQLSEAIANPEYKNFVFAIIAVAISIAGIISSSAQAKKTRNLQESIAMAQLAVQKNLAEEQIRAEAETARTGILLNTLQQYRSDLQVQSTKRLADVGIYTGIMATSLALLYSVYYLFKPQTP